MRHEKFSINLSGGEKSTEELKTFLEGQGLTAPISAGDISKGIPEIVSITDVWWNGNFFADFEVQVVWAAGKPSAPFVMRSNKGGPGAVFVPIIDGKIALVRQFRPCLGKFTWEIPRGFYEKWDAENVGRQVSLNKATIPAGFATVMRELVEEVGDGDVVEATLLAKIAENSGSTTTAPSYYSLKIKEAKLGGTEGLKVKLVDVNSIMAMIGTEIIDNHSIVAITLVLKQAWEKFLRLD